ncbi:hypothetical protein J2Z49_000493 [Desulfofundulus luciae]|uniref:DUF4351 domain-containing protein n=1 Tax=Desulfofundulus luciae TaxID=74702 RepID=A0ABU0AY71_9FIRM|nr:hypothetical protein [Desulfofundulus luciae]
MFYLDQTVDPLELVVRLRKLAGVLKGMTPEQFRQVTVWLKNVIKRKLPVHLREEVERVLEENDPREVEKMITNIERALDEMKRQAVMEGVLRGKAEGEARGKVEAKQDAICKYLRRRFGDASAGLQRKVREMTSLEVLDGVMEELFAANTLEEARAIIRDGIERFMQ